MLSYNTFVCFISCAWFWRWGWVVKKLMILGVALALSLANSVTAVAQAKPIVLVSIPPLALIARDIVGDLATVDVLLDGSVNPHDYVLKPSDMQRIRAASAVFWVGPGVDGFLQKPLNGVMKGRNLALSAIDGLRWPDDAELSHAEGHGDHHDHDHAGHDPHIWLDPVNVGVMANAMVNHLTAMGGLDPAARQQLRSQTEFALANWQQIPSRWQGAFGNQAHFAAYHRAYDHLAAAFGLTQDAVITQSPEQQPGARHLWEVSNQLTQQQCLLVEPYYSQKMAQKLGQSTGVNLVAIDLLAAQQVYKSYMQWLETAVLRPIQACLQQP